MDTANAWMTNGKMPPEVAKALYRAIAQTRRVIALRGISAVSGIALIALFVVMAVDARTVFMDAWPRWVMSGLAYGVTVAAFFWFLVRPLRRTFSLAGMARIIEQRHPELQERLSSIVELTGSADSEELRGSQTLIAALAGQTLKDAEGVRPSDAASWMAIRRWVGAAGFLFLALAAVFVWRPHETAVLFARAALPMANLSNLSALELVVKPGDARVGEGRPLTIFVSAPARRGLEALLVMESPRTRRQTVLNLTPFKTDAPGRSAWTGTLDRVESDFSYRIRVDRAITRRFLIRAVPPPVIRSVTVSYEYPAYTALARREVADAGGSIHGIAHTKVRLQVRVNKPIARPELVFSGTTAAVVTQRLAVAKTGEEILSYSFTLTPGLNGLAALKLTDEYGFVNPPWERTVQAVPDARPAIKVGFPDQPVLKLARQDSLPMMAVAADDFGLSRAEWRIAAPGRPPVVRPFVLALVSNRLPCVTQQSQEVNLWDPALTGAVSVVATFHAADNRDPACGGPQWVSSGPFTVTFDEAARSVEEQALAAQAEFVQKQLEKTVKELTQARDQLKALADQPAASTNEAGVRKLDESQVRAAEASADLKTLAEAAKDGFLEKAAKEAERIESEPVAEARKGMDRIPLLTDSTDRALALTQAVASVQAALEQTQALSSNVVETAEAVKQALALKDLAERRETPETPAQLKQDVERLAEVMKSLPQAALAESLSNKLENTARESEKIREAQDALSADVKKSLDPAATEAKVLQELAVEQETLAREAAARPEVATLAPAMQKAAEAVKQDQLQQALQEQMKAAEALRDQAAEERRLAATAMNPQAAEKLADALVRETDQSAKRAEEAAASTERLKDVLEQAARKADEKVLEKTDAKNAAALKEEAKETRKMAEEAGRDAREVAALADKNAGLAVQAAREAAVGEPLEKVADTARQARETAKQAEGIEAKMANKAAPLLEVPKRADRAVDRAQRAEKEAAATAEETRQLGAVKETAQAAEAAKQAKTAAETARQAADQAKAAPTPDAAKKAVTMAETAAESADKGARQAEQALDMARKDFLKKELADIPGKQAERKADLAVKRADQADAQARESAAQAEKAAQKMEQAARQAAEQAQKAQAGKRPEAAQKGQEAVAKKAQAEEAKTWSAAAAFAANQAKQQAQKAADEAKKTAAETEAAKKDAAAARTEEAARQAESAARRTDEFGDKAKSAAAPAVSDAERIEKAAEQAKSATVEAKKASEQTKAVVEAVKATPVEPAAQQLNRQAEESARRAQEFSDQAARQAAQARQAKKPEQVQEARKQAEKAAESARQAADEGIKAAEIADELAAAAPLPQARADQARQLAEESARQAAQAAERARESAKVTPASTEAKAAAEEAGQAAGKAQQAAQEARQAAAEAAMAPKREEAAVKAVQAETAALKAVEQAMLAERQANRAEAAAPAVTPAERRAKAAQQAAQSAAEAKAQSDEAARAAAAAEKSAEQAKALSEAAEKAKAANGETMKALAGKAGEAGEAARQAAEQAEKLAQEARRNQEQAAQASSASAAEARAMDAAEKADEARRLAREAGTQAELARSAAQSEKAAQGQDLAERQRELAARTRDVQAGQMKPEPETWRRAEARQEEVAAAVEAMKDDFAVARMMAEAMKKPEAVRALEQASGQTAPAAEAAKAAATDFEKTAGAVDQARKAELDNAAAPAQAAAAMRSAQEAEKQAGRQAESVQAAVSKALDAAQVQAQAAKAAMGPVPAAAPAAAPAATPESEGGEKAAAEDVKTMAERIPEALGDMQGELRKGGSETDPGTGENLKKAAEAAARRAEAMGGKPDTESPRMNMPAVGGGGSDKPGEVPDGWGYDSEMRLRNWLKFSGELHGDVMENAADGEPEDYRGLIRSYFEEVSRRSHEE